MKTAQALKVVAIGTGVIIGGLVIFRAYRLAQSAGQGLANIPAQLGDGMRDVGALIAEQFKIAEASVQRVYQETVGNVADSVNGAVGAVTGQNPTYSTGYARAVPSNKWDASTKALIGDFNQRHGRARLNYAGWQVFTDGTIISPAGDYLQMDYTAAAMESAGGYAVKDIFSPAGDPFASIYPGAENFTAAGYKNEITTAPLSENAPPYFIAF